jgi:gamma-polyglutamate biosynthesis protein CapA
LWLSGLSHCLADINQVENSSDLVIVYAHWGNEYQSNSNLAIQTIAHKLIDAGADVIIGSHPHVVQESEIYNGKVIYYSLGNFIFDQYFMPETQQGLLVKMVIDMKAETIAFIEYPILLLPTGQTILK